MIRKMSIGLRLSLVLGGIVLMLLVVGLTGINRQSHLNSVVETLVDHRVASLAEVNRMSESFLTMRLYTANLLVAKSLADVQRFNNAYKAAFEAKNRASDAYDELIISPQARDIFDQMKVAMAQYESRSNEMRRLIAAGQEEAGSTLLEQEIIPIATKVTESLEQLVEFQTNRINSSADEAEITYKDGRNLSATAMVIVVVLVIFAAWLLTRSITIPLGEALGVASRVAKKDLTVPIKMEGNDEITELLKALSLMQTQLRDDIGDIANSADQLAAASEELSAVTNETNVALQTQNEELEQAASAVTELTVAIEEVAGNSNETAKVSMDADEQTKIGLGLVKDTVNAIEALVKDIQANANNVEDLAKKVSDVASVLDVIRTIAEQTNLLALNAAIEAARAGEAGRGFAVVADEVRGLASRTADSTKEIESIIGSVETGTQKAVASMNEGRESANRTLNIGIKAGESLQKIAQAITVINDRNTASASATEEQAAVAKEVDRNLVTIRDIAVQTNAGASQTSIASGELARLAEALSELVGGFKI